MCVSDSSSVKVLDLGTWKILEIGLTAGNSSKVSLVVSHSNVVRVQRRLVLILFALAVRIRTRQTIFLSLGKNFNYRCEWVLATCSGVIFEENKVSDF